MRDMFQGGEDAGRAAMRTVRPPHTWCVEVKRADSREADRCCWWAQQSVRISPKGFTVHDVSIAGSVGMHVRGAGRGCVQSALRSTHSCCCGWKMCLFSAAWWRELHVDLSYTPGVHAWRGSALHCFVTKWDSRVSWTQHGHKRWDKSAKINQLVNRKTTGCEIFRLSINRFSNVSYAKMKTNDGSVGVNC